MKLTLDPGAAALLDTLHAAGYAAYAVGRLRAGIAFWDAPPTTGTCAPAPCRSR